MGCPSLRQPSRLYARASIVSRMNRTEPSAFAKFAPPVWLDLKPQVTPQFHMQFMGSTPGHPSVQEFLLLSGFTVLEILQFIGGVVVP